MQIAIINCPNKIKRADVANAVKFYADILMHKNLIKNLNITINFADTGPDGSCLIEDEFAKPREFVLQINPKKSKEKIFCALAHEMVHVKQYATGESKNYERKPHIVRFRGIMVNTNTTAYWDQPWEIEAYGREYGLYVRFLENEYAKEKADKKKPGR